MSIFNPERTKLIKRSIFWLMLLITVMGITYYYEKNLFQNNLEMLTASTSTNEPLISCVQTDKPQVALSFDTACGNEDTRQLLDILKKYNIHATFFMTGEWVKTYPDDVEAVFEDGHDLGNHSESHKQMSNLSNTQISDELNLVTNNVKKLTGVTMTLFRPPYNDYNSRLITQIKSEKYYPIGWSVDSLDWKNYGADSIVDAILNNKNLKNGSIILLHNGAKYTPEALPKIIEGLNAKGFDIVPISQLIYKTHYHIKADGTQISDDKN